MNRYYFADSISNFLKTTADKILGALSRNHAFALEETQRDAWLGEIAILQKVLFGLDGKIYFEYSIPRMGKRIDVVLLIGPVIFVLEFKVGEKEFSAYAIDQVWDYALDLKNFHESNHECFISARQNLLKYTHGTLDVWFLLQRALRVLPRLTYSPQA